MQELHFFLIFLTGAFAWFTGAVSGVSGSLIFLPVATLLLPIEIVTPTTVLTLLISDLVKMVFFGSYANPAVLKRTLPKITAFALTGVWLFTVSDLRVYLVFMFLFYLFRSAFKSQGLSSLFTGYFGLSGLKPTGSIEDIGTFYALRFMCGLTAVCGFIFFEIIKEEILLSGAAAGVGALIGCCLGGKFSGVFNDRFFRVFVSSSLIICVLIILTGLL